MPITIREVIARDIRFPTSDESHGSDAMHPDPDYSAAYVVLHTDAANEVQGHGLTFTVGRGNELCVAAVESLAPLVLFALPGLLPALLYVNDIPASAALASVTAAERGRFFIDRDGGYAVTGQVVGHLDRDIGLAVAIGSDLGREHGQGAEVLAHCDGCVGRRGACAFGLFGQGNSGGRSLACRRWLAGTSCKRTSKWRWAPSCR